MSAHLGYHQEDIMARRAALTDRSGVVAGAGLVHDEHRLLVEIQMKAAAEATTGEVAERMRNEIARLAAIKSKADIQAKLDRVAADEHTWEKNQSHEEETAGGTHEAAGPKSWSKRLMRSFRFDHVLDDEAEGDAPAAPAPNMLTRLKRATSKMWISGGGATSSKHIMLNNDHGWFKDGSKSIKPLIRATSKMWFAGGASSKHVLYINPAGEGWMTKAKSIVSTVTAKLFGFKGNDSEQDKNEKDQSAQIPSKSAPRTSLKSNGLLGSVRFPANVTASGVTDDLPHNRITRQQEHATHILVKPKPTGSIPNNDEWLSNGMTGRSSATMTTALPSILLKGGSTPMQQRQNTAAIGSRPSPAVECRYSHEDDEEFFASAPRPDPRGPPRMLLHDVVGSRGRASPSSSRTLEQPGTASAPPPPVPGWRTLLSQRSRAQSVVPE